MLINIIEIITFVAVVLYLLFGGADYGAGVLEFFRRKSLRDELEEIVTKTIGPVWEANHIWLILIVVILFVGFPPIYLSMTTYLHIPVVAILVGIVLRGVAFTFRHYDIFDGKPASIYRWTFSMSSIWTSFWLGVTAGACLLGRINPEGQNVFELYVAPWLNVFSFSVGIFVTCVFTYLASSFLIGETAKADLKAFFIKRAFAANLAVIMSGGIVFLAAEIDGISLFARFFSSPLAITMMVVATFLWVLQWFFRHQWNFFFGRLIVAAQIVFILLGLLVIEHPIIIKMMNGNLTLQNSAAPEATLISLLIALVVGLVVIIPSIILLFWIFKAEKK